MSREKNNLYIGAIIILIGVLILLSNINILHDLDDLFGGAFLLLLSFLFFNVYNRDRSKWWPLLPATVLAVLGAGVVLQSFLPFASDLIGAAFMFSVFSVFAYVYSRQPSQWWAVIPPGTAFTLGVIVLVDEINVMSSEMGGVVFFLGLGLTFYYLWSLRSDNANLNWAVWPASVLMILAIITYVDQATWLNDEFIFPLLLVLAGVMIIASGMRKNKKS